MNRTRIIQAALLALFVPVAAASTQSAPSRWAAWIGCWEPVSEGATGRSVTCVVPGDSPDAAELVILAGDSVVQRSTIIADGTTRTIDADGCTGTEVARFSDDGTRVFLDGKVGCSGGPEQATSGVISISETGQWLDVHGVRVGEQRSLRVRRSRPLSDLASVPASIRSVLVARSRGDAGARVGAAMPLTLARVEETAMAVDERVAEAWLLESSRDGSELEPVDARQLARIEAAGVPDRVIDVVIALGYPKQFQVAITADGSAELSEAQRAGGSAAGIASTRMYPDVMGYSLYGSPRCYTYSCYLYYSDSPYMSGLAGWNNYGGWGMYPGWGYGGPITIIVRPSEPGNGGDGGAGSGGGRVVKGRGYTPSGSSGASAPARPRETAPAATTRSAGSSSSSGTATRSSGQGSSTSGSSTKSEPRTAQRKP
jgi:hypothetical protein